MHILLYVPDNQVTRNFLPQLWPFLLQRLTPAEHRVTVLDGNVVRYTPAELANFVVQQGVDLVGMGFMSRAAEQAYVVADVLRRDARVPVVMGGPHVTALPCEPLGMDGEPRHADTVVVGEADETWPTVVRDAQRNRLQQIYSPPTRDGREHKPSLEDYPSVAWDQINLEPFDLMRFVPGTVRSLLKRLRIPYEKAYVIPVETGRGCPYGCEFCTVTGFFGNQVRFRSNDNVVDELLLLKALARRHKALVSVFFIDDNFAINRARVKALLREIIRRDAILPWVAQISINLLKDAELVELMAASGGRWVFIGLESVDTDSLQAVRKPFNKPHEYWAILDSLAKHDIYAITSFILGMEADRPGASRRIADQIETWPPGLPVFGLLTPYPATPLYQRLSEEGRLTRPRHWLDFQAFKTAFVPRNISAVGAEREVHESWRRCYRPRIFFRGQRWMLQHGKPFDQQVMLFVARLLFRGIYFPQMTRWPWIKVLARNLPTILSLIASGLRAARDTTTRRRT